MNRILASPALLGFLIMLCVAEVRSARAVTPGDPVCQQIHDLFCDECPGFESCVCLSEGGNLCPSHHITCYTVKYQVGGEGNWFAEFEDRIVNCYDIAPCSIEFPGSLCGPNNRCLITGPAVTVTSTTPKLGKCFFNPPGG